MRAQEEVKQPSPSQLRLMRALHERQRQCQSFDELSDGCGISQNSLYSLVSRLRRNHMVETSYETRVTREGIRRKTTVVRLTPKGQKFIVGWNMFLMGLS